MSNVMTRVYYLPGGVRSTLLKWPSHPATERDPWRDEADLAAPPQADRAGQHRQDEHGAPAPQFLPGHHLPGRLRSHRPRRGLLCGQGGPRRKGTLQKDPLPLRETQFDKTRLYSSRAIFSTTRLSSGRGALASASGRRRARWERTGPRD